MIKDDKKTPQFFKQIKTLLLDHDIDVDYHNIPLSKFKSKDFDFDNSNPVRCAYRFYGTTKIQQQTFFCTSCDPFKQKKMCEYCYNTCHLDCKLEGIDEVQNEGFDSFYCLCGAKMRHCAKKHEGDKKLCTMRNLDILLNNHFCYQVEQRNEKRNENYLCSICYNQCHSQSLKCPPERGLLQSYKCACTHSNHIQYENIAYFGPIQQYLGTIDTEPEIFSPLEVLNLIFSQNFPIFAKKIQDEIHCDGDNISNINNRNLFSLLISIFSKTFRENFNIFYFNNDILKNMFPLSQLKKYFSELIKCEHIDDIRMKFRLISIFLFIHLKRIFGKIKNFTTRDFIVNNLLGRLEHRKFILSDNMFTNEFYQNKETVLNFFQEIFHFSVQCDQNFEVMNNEYEYFLKTFSYVLKMMILNREELLKYIEDFKAFHDKVHEYLSDKMKFPERMEEIRGIVEQMVKINLLLAVNYNDSVVYHYLDSCGNITTMQRLISKAKTNEKLTLPFIHTAIDDPNKKDARILFKMVIQNYKILAQYSLLNDNSTAYAKSNNSTCLQKIIFLSNHTLKLFSVVDNSYYSQIKSLTNNDFLLYFHAIQSHLVLKNLDYNSFQFEDSLHNYFTANPKDKQQHLIDLLAALSMENLFQIEIPKLFKEKVEESSMSCNFLIKMYPYMKAAANRSSIISENLESFVNKLIFCKFDHTLTKVLLWFSEKKLLGIHHIDSIFSALLVFLFSSRGTKYISTGKSLIRIEKVLRNLMTEDLRLKRDGLCDEVVEKKIQVILEFLYLVLKRVKQFRFDIKHHKIIAKLKSAFMYYLKESSGLGLTNEVKIKVALILKSFACLSQFLEHKELESTHLAVINFFNADAINFTGYLKSFSKIHHSSSSNKHIVSYSCCGNISQDELILNSRMFFAFFYFISRNVYYISQKHQKEYEIFYSQDTDDYKLILSSSSICIKHRLILSRFLKTYYFIDIISNAYYTKRDMLFTNDDLENYFHHLTYCQLNLHEKLKQNEMLIHIVEDSKVICTEDEFEKLRKKKSFGDNLLHVLKIFQNEIINFERNILEVLNVGGDKYLKQGKLYIQELLFIVQNISGVFYSESDISHLLFVAYRDLIQTFLNLKDELLNISLQLIEKIDRRPSTQQRINNDKTFRSIDVRLCDSRALLSIISECICEISQKIQIEVRHDLGSYVKLFDKNTELDFSSYVLIKTKDYEYFYEQNNKDDPTKDNMLVSESILTQYTSQFTNIDKTHFFRVLGDFTNEFDIEDYRQCLISYFIAYMKLKPEQQSLNIYECIICVITKMLFYSTTSTKTKINIMFRKREDVIFLMKKLRSILQENINHMMVLSKNSFEKVLLKFTTATKLTIEFLQMLINTNIEYAIFGLEIPKEKFESVSFDVEDVNEIEIRKETQVSNIHVEDDSDDELKTSIFELLKANLLSIYRLLEIDLKVNFALPYDEMIVLMTNIISFILVFIDSKNEVIQDIISQAMKEINSEINQTQNKKCFLLNLSLNDVINKEDHIQKWIDVHPRFQLRKILMLYVADQFIELFCAFLKTGKNDKKKLNFVTEQVMKCYTPDDLFRQILLHFKDLFSEYKIEKHDTVYVNIFDGEFQNKLERKYAFDADFKEDLRLKVCFKLFILIKIIEDNYLSISLRDQYPIMGNHNFGGVNLKKYETSKFEKKVSNFLNRMIIKVDIKRPIDEESSKFENEEIYFIRPAITFHITTDSSRGFENSVQRDNAATKWGGLVSGSDLFMFEMMYIHKTYDDSLMYSLHKNLNMDLLHILNYLIIIAQNVILVVTYYRPPSMRDKDYEDAVSQEAGTDINYWVGIFHAVFLITVLFFSSVFFPITVQHSIMTSYRKNFLIRTKESKENVVIPQHVRMFDTNRSKFLRYDLSFLQCIRTYLSAIFLHYRTTAFLLTLLLLIGFFVTKHPIWLVLPAVLIMNISDTLFSIFKAVQLRWWQLVTVLVYTYLLIYVFMWLGMFYLQDLFFLETVEVMSGETITESYCTSTIQCLLKMIDRGVRSGGGIGDIMNKVSYREDVNYFIMRFFYVLVFHILIILVMGNVFLGIIVDTFASLRDQVNMIEEDRKNVCFICQLTRNQSLERRIDFDAHRDEKHFMWNYIYFLTYLHIGNPHDLSSLERYVWEQLGDGNLNWIPLDLDA